MSRTKEKKPTKFKSINLHIETYDEIAKLGTFNNSVEDIIRKLLDYYYNHNHEGE